jgi:glycosyltransferase involved in cell wall biosynthesis
MRVSVVIRSKDEADRLRLTLTSLALQTVAPEVVVVNDGSSDHTVAVVEEAASMMDVVAVHCERPRGRSGAANAGAARATGDAVLFLDGDTLAAPDMVELHREQHAVASNRIVRGENWHVRCTRPYLDPEKGTPRPGQEAAVAKMSSGERSRSLVTRADIRHSFESIEKRAQLGTYPGFGPRKLQELEMSALADDRESSVLWAAASGSNLSVRRDAFLAIGGFDEELTINEHREMALRLYENGLRMGATRARTFHLTHRTGWRDPLEDTAWEQRFYATHPIPEVALLRFFWAGLSDVSPRGNGRIATLYELAACAERYRGIQGLERVHEAHLTFPLGLS